MKKSTCFAFITVTLIVLILQSFGSKTILYEKKKEYTSQEDVIKDYLTNVNLLWGNRGSNGQILNIIPNLDFYETISNRYRLKEEKDSSINNNNNIPYFKEYNIEDVTASEGRILEDALNSYKSIKNYKVPISLEVYKVTGVGIDYPVKYTNDDINGEFEILNKNQEYRDIEIYLIVVDEGDGYVIDNWLYPYK